MKWFKHDTDANMDAKLQEVMLDYGLEGYGLYWYCIELIAQRVNGDNLTFELEHDCRIIARNTGSTPQKVEQMMKSFIKLGLLNTEDGHVFCLKLASRCDDFTAKAVRRNGVKALNNQSVGVSPIKSVFVPLEEEVEEEKEIDKVTLVKSTTKRSKFKFTSDDYQCAEWIYSLVKKVAPASKKPNFESWANTVRLMRESDKLTYEDISQVFIWTNQDSFWSVNILSAAKLREKFPQLQAKMKGANNERTTSNGKKLSAYERARAANAEYRQPEPNEREVVVGANDGRMGRTMDEGKGRTTLEHVDNGTFIDYE
jgi:hypothetical protein